MRTEQTNMKVVVRVRPYNNRELELNQRSVIKVLDTKTLLFDPDEDEEEFFFQGTKQNFRDITKRTHKKLSMDFDRVFGTDVTNTEIFKECTAPLVEAVLNGYNCSVFVYGATGAGKTFTMLGNYDCPGLTYLTMRDLFQKIDSQSHVKKFNVAVSYLEIYNELIIDLLSKSGPLKLLEDNNGVIVSGLMPKPIFNAEELLELLAKGNANRTQHPTDANAESSRSHAIFQVHIRITDKKTDAKRTVKLSMIDLAGSERAASTKGNGTRFREGASINKSLLALGNCINNLADGLKHIPYRGSNLTRILKDSLGGNCQTLMVANVSMSSSTYEDTYNTLKYASRAKKIRTTVRKNTLKSNMPKDFYIRKVDELMTASQRDKETIKSLEAKLAVVQSTTGSSMSARSCDENEVKGWYRKMDAVYSNVIKVQEYAIGLQSKIKLGSLTVKFKEYAHYYCQKLTLNKPLLKEEIEHFSAVLSSHKKQTEIQCEESSIWREKLRDAYNDLDKLKKEIKSEKYADILHLYQKCKDLELRNCKEEIHRNHLTNMNTYFTEEMKKLRQIVSTACDALQSYYNDYGIRTDLKSSLDEIQQIMRSNIALATDDVQMLIMNLNSNGEQKTNQCHETSPPVALKSSSMATKRKTLKTAESNYNNELGLMSTAKRQRMIPMYLDFENEFALDAEDLDNESVSSYQEGHSAAIEQSSSNSVFKVPTTCCTVDLNRTTVLSSLQEVDKTFEASSSSNISSSHNSHDLQKKKTYVASLLSDKLVTNPKNKEQVKKVLLKSQNFSHRGVAKTVTLGIQKENMKYSPSRIRKSPRSMAAKSTAHHVNRAAPIPSNRGGGGNVIKAPTVRINRAASFRTKK